MSVSDKFRVENPQDWDDKMLAELLVELTQEHILNEMTRHRAIIQALTILNIQNQRHFDRIEKRNLILTWLIVALTVTSILMPIFN